MRLRVCLRVQTETVVPINYQELLTAAIYGLLEKSHTDFARFLHDEGYSVDGGPKHFKLFHFGWLRGRHRAEGDRLRFAPGHVEWQIGSPLPEFLTHLATGLLATRAVRVGAASLPIESIETTPNPIFTADGGRWTCLSPVVCALPLPGGGTRYLRPADTDEFSEAVRRNLLAKYKTLHSQPPEDDTLRFVFDAAYLARSPGTKKITFKGIDIVGAFAPFTLFGSPELQELGYQVGFGEKNAAGFGMAECAP